MGRDGKLETVLVKPGVVIWVGVRLTDGDALAGKLGEADNVTSAPIWEEEQALRRKREKTILTFFMVMHLTESVMKNPCIETQHLTYQASPLQPSTSSIFLPLP